MKLRRSFLGYISFGIGTLVLSVYLYTLFVSLFEYIEKNNGVSVLILGINGSYVVSVFLYGLVVLLFWALYVLFSKFRKTKISKKCAVIVYWVLFAVISLLFIFYSYNFVFSNKSVLMFSDDEFNSLIDAFENGIPNFLPLKKLYLLICVFLMKTFGTSETVILTFNLALVMLGSLFVAFSSYYLWGKTVSLASFAVMFLKYSSVKSIDLSGENFLFFMIAFFVFFLSFFLDILARKKPSLGVIFSSLVVISIPICTWFLFDKFEMSFFFYKVEEFIYIEKPETFILIFSVFALFNYFSYLKASSDRITFSVVLLIILFVLLIFGNNSIDFEIYSLWIWSILFGLGIEALFVPEGYVEISKAQKVEKPKAEILEKEEKISKTENEIQKKDAVSEKVESDNAPKKDNKPVFLDNPLPVPKKHVKKSISYAFEPSEDLMKYDIDVSPDDDFDFK